MGISDRGTKAKTITSCDNAFVTNILPLTLRFRAKKHPAADASLSRKKNILLPRRPQEALLCAKAKRQQLFYLCESVATATTNVFCSESKAAATNRPAGTEIDPTL
ncbi:hypothetical protein ACQKMI_22145 [Lysinibacillus sp. NPDC097214]|uniref:hypothetical protein n=1 Tax=Lysinibacillus sp. NPDC097214 TaxID=3390584 RepID=UPI003D01F8CB